MSIQKFGEFLKTLRMKTGKTLRAFCQDNGIDPGNWSRLERGKMVISQGEKLDEYAQKLSVEKNSDDYYTLCDLASAARGEIPVDIMSDDAVVAKLPLLFRRLRQDGSDLDEIINIVKKS